jgi:alkaline phosphatase D
MQRRGFIAGLAAGAVGWVVGGRRAGFGQDFQPAYQNPVPFIDSAAAATSQSLFTINQAATELDRLATYPQSVAAGDPNPHGVVIWTRVSPDAVAAGGSETVAWQIANASDFGDGSIVLAGTAPISEDVDHTVKLPLQNAAMRPFTTYYYRFIYDGITSRVGRFKTMPQPGDTLSQLKVGYVVCQDYSNGFYNAYGYLAQEDVDVVVFLGDYIYEYLNDGVGGPNNGPVRVVPDYPLGGQYPQGLEDYRHLYKVYRADPNIQAAHEKFAFILLWDDHEYFNDCHQDYHEDTNPPGLTAKTPQPKLRQAATQAWSEHGLAATPFNPNKNWENSIQVYRNFKFGTLTDIVVTDERLYRDGPPCGDVDIGERYETTGCAAQYKPSRTMLGAKQKAWFLREVAQSTATWKIWANEVMLCQYLFGPPLAPEIIFFDLDQWDGYPDERAEILSAIQAAKVKNFVVLSGDAHLYLASYLKTNFNDPNEEPMGVELMVGAISSGNYLDAGVDSPAPSSVPAAAKKAANALTAAGLPQDSLEPVILEYNPHMVFWNGSTWGYAILTITPDQMVCVYKTPSTVKSETSTLNTLATFTVPNGVVQLIPS